MGDYPYYDYKKDFPKGNGWSESIYANYKGEEIDSPLYIFQNGKYKGKSLQFIAEYCWRGIIKYIDYGLIHITRDCLKKLRCGEKKKRAIWIANDAKLTFCHICGVRDELYSKPYPCLYQGESFMVVAQKDPLYLMGLIDRAFRPHYGRNQRFYASDKCYTLFDYKTINLETITTELKDKGLDNEIIEFLISLHNDLLDEKNREEEEQNYYYQQALENEMIEEGYRSAFENIPEAEWNID